MTAGAGAASLSDGLWLVVRRPRITVSVDQGQYVTLRRLSRARGVSVGQLVRELLDAVEPALGRAAGLLETAARAQAEIPERLRLMVDEEAEDMEALGELFELFESMRSRGETLEVSAGKNPRPVTRGLGGPNGEAGHADGSSSRARS